MTILSGLGIVLSLVFGCLLLALVAELYYLLWWKKQRIISSNTPTANPTTIQQDYSTHAKEMFYLFCWDKPTTIFTNPTSTNPNGSNPDGNQHVPDIETGLGGSRKDLLLKAFGDENIDPDSIMSLAGHHHHSRFLFTITEETKEDLESDDGKSKGDKSMKRSRTKSLSDLIMALETHSPMCSPNKCNYNHNYNYTYNNYNYNNPLFESSVEAELNRLRSSPPPKFKFLRDAEEKLYRKLLEEAQKSGLLQQEEVILGNSLRQECSEEEKHGFLMRNNGETKKMKKEKEKEKENINCNSQVIPLASSPSCDSKQPCLH